MIVASRDGDLWLKLLPDGAEMQLTELTDVTGFPEFSPDGKRILIQREGPPALVSRSMGEEVPTSTWWAVAVPDGAPYMILEPLEALPLARDRRCTSTDQIPSQDPSPPLVRDRQISLQKRQISLQKRQISLQKRQIPLQKRQIPPQNPPPPLARDRQIPSQDHQI